MREGEGENACVLGIRVLLMLSTLSATERVLPAYRQLPILAADSRTISRSVLCCLLASGLCKAKLPSTRYRAAVLNYLCSLWGAYTLALPVPLGTLGQAFFILLELAQLSPL